MKKEEDIILWNSFLEGDENAYAHIYELYAQEVFSYGVLFSTNHELVRDCMHDVFVKIYRNRGSLGKVDNIKLYLFVAMKNRLFDVFCKDKVLYHNETVEPVFSLELTVEDEFIYQEEQQYQSIKMHQMLDSLSPRQKEVLYYRYIENMSYDEIQEIMQMNYQSVLNLIQRSLKKLRTSFSQSYIYLPFILGIIIIQFFFR